MIRFLKGLFYAISGEVYMDFETIPTGDVTQIDVVIGTGTVAFFVGRFYPRED